PAATRALVALDPGEGVIGEAFSRLCLVGAVGHRRLACRAKSARLVVGARRLLALSALAVAVDDRVAVAALEDARRVGLDELGGHHALPASPSITGRSAMMSATPVGNCQRARRPTPVEVCG